MKSTRNTVAVKPGSTKGPLVEEQVDGSLLVYLRERAVDGKANDALVKALAKHFDVAKTRVEIVRGAASRHKVVRIQHL